MCLSACVDEHPEYSEQFPNLNPPDA
jgi:hypothetical protein